jgi:hypothetical protein
MNLLHKTPDLKVEFLRRKTNRQRMLIAFKREGELTTKDLLRFGPGLSSRLKELRNDGHRIVCRYERPGLYTYVYLGNKNDEDQTNVSVID